MNSVTQLTADQLRQAADIQERIEALQNELQQILQGAAPAAVPTYTARRTGPRKRTLSPQAVENIRAGVRKRMARMQRAVASGQAPAVRPKKKISPEGRARLAAIARARWKRVKALGKSRL